jgi:hypothetical protein
LTNEAVVGRWIEALNGEDFEAAMALVHPEIEFIPPGGQPPYRGAESLRRWMEPDALQGQVIEPLETLGTSNGTVLVKQRVKARGASSGFPLDAVSWSVWRFDDEGLITWGQIFLEHEEDAARDAAGLSE